MSDMDNIRKALPFWLSLGLIPLAVIGVTQGGWTVILMPAYAWTLVTVLDLLLGQNEENPDPQTSDDDLFWYRLVTLIWFPLQALIVYGAIWWITRTSCGST